jgi:hypothetical protein
LLSVFKSGQIEAKEQKERERERGKIFCFVLENSTSFSSCVPGCPSLNMAQEVVVTAIGSPIPHTLYPFLAVLLLIVGLVLTAAFFIYEATTSKFSRSLSREFATGGVASLFLGFGTLFLLLWTGVYV